MLPKQFHPHDAEEIKYRLCFVPQQHLQAVCDEYTHLYMQAPSISMARRAAGRYLKKTARAFHIEAYNDRRVK